MGMGKKLCENFKVASDIFDEASESLSEDVKKLCFESSLEELTLTKNAQPAILTVSMAMYHTWLQEIGIMPDMVAGHSLGEITALTCAGAINFADAVKIARKRGEFMQEAVEPGKGLMAAVKTRDVNRLKRMCEEVSNGNEIVSISNYNSGVQTVISGDKSAVEKILDLLSKEDIKATLLNVSAPFHCPLMQKAADKLEEELQKYHFEELRHTVISNVTASPYQGKKQIISNLKEQLVLPVQWVNSMKYLKKTMVRYCIELGPKSVMKDMMKKNIADIPVLSYDVEKDANGARQYIDSLYVPFLSRAMGLAVATRNSNWDSVAYEKGVVEPYNKVQKIQQLIEDENRTATEDEMQEGINMLRSVFKTKLVTEDEQIERFKELFQDSGTVKLFENFQVPTMN